MRRRRRRRRTGRVAAQTGARRAPGLCAAAYRRRTPGHRLRCAGGRRAHPLDEARARHDRHGGGGPIATQGADPAASATSQAGQRAAERSRSPRALDCCGARDPARCDGARSPAAQCAHAAARRDLRPPRAAGTAHRGRRPPPLPVAPQRLLADGGDRGATRGRAADRARHDRSRARDSHGARRPHALHRGADIRRRRLAHSRRLVQPALSGALAAGGGRDRGLGPGARLPRARDVPEPRVRGHSPRRRRRHAHRPAGPGLPADRGPAAAHAAHAHRQPARTLRRPRARAAPGRAAQAPPADAGGGRHASGALPGQRRAAA